MSEEEVLDDAIETESEPRILLCYSNINSEDVYSIKLLALVPYILSKWSQLLVFLA